MDDSEELKPLFVPCLMGIEQLQSAAETQNVRIGDSTRKYLVLLVLNNLGPHHVQKLIVKFVEKGVIKWEDDMYEVEFILDHCEDENTGDMYYLIKWEGWSDEHNSWEPRSNLQCDEVIQQYTAYIQNHGHGVKRKYSEISRNNGHQPKSKAVLIDELFKKLCSSNVMSTLTPMDILNIYSPAKKVKKINTLIGPQSSRCPPSRLVAIRHKKQTKRMKKADVAEALADWERDMNSIIQGFDSAPIRVVNDVDIEGPPDTFVYINQCKEGSGVTIPKDPPFGCECDDCFSSKKTCCAACSGTEFAYYRNRRIRLAPGRPVYECNTRCKCGPDCVNRVVQKGRKFRISIFRTKNGRGWGVKTLQAIKKGSFVMEYVGEVITHEEAERRGQVYDSAGRTYLFDLDFTDSNTSFTVDAGVYGNAAHFINHSCDPNMEVYCVWVNCLDPRLPHICLFAKRDIKKDEELSFDYMCARSSLEEDGEVTLKEPSIALSPKKTQSDAANSLVEKEDIVAVSPKKTQSDVDNSPVEKEDPQSDPDNSLVEKEDPQSDPDNSLVEKEDIVALGEPGDSINIKGIAISPKSKDMSSTIVNKGTTVCQCGAPNCRKYLF